jgi:hypothetical protein
MAPTEDRVTMPTLNADVVLGVPSSTARDYQEDLMHAIARRHGYQSEFARRYFS